MPTHPQFLFITCQVGAERAVKGEMARRWSDFHFAFSRPGFLTFRLPEDAHLQADFDPGAVFARAHGFSLGKVAGDDPLMLARGAWALLGHRPFQRIHVWERDRSAPGEHGFEPSIGPAAVAAYQALRETCPQPGRLTPEASDLDGPACQGDWILDCVLVEPAQWWVGFHRADGPASRWPGGMLPLELPPHAVSRAWLKMEEALRWSQLPIPPGARCAEIGSAPGGASQSLLERGFEVMGIDPAEMAPAVLAHQRFRHVRRRAPDVPRREFRKIRWLMADMNVAPSYTLDSVEAVVTHPEVNIRGMLLTLKLSDWKLADEVAGYLDRIRGWGYQWVRARQLQHNRREFCIAALQKPFRRKPSAR